MMTSISAGAAPRVHRTGVTAATAATTRRMTVQTSAVLVGLLLALVAVLVVDNHLMPLPGASFAEIGVARSHLDSAAERDADRSTAGRGTAPGGSARAAGSSGTSPHDLHRCFVRARRSGQDPAGCRVSQR